MDYSPFVMKQVTLRQARRQKKLTQEQLEAMSGVSQSVISTIERGDKADPASSTLLKLAAALDLDPRALKLSAQSEVA